VRGLYLVTDRALCAPRPVEAVVEEALRGGVDAVQLREKTLSTREFLAAAVRLKTLLAPRGVPLLVNDRVDIALAAGADGVHLGQNDLPCQEARRLLGRSALIGLSVETKEQLLQAEDWEVDYVALSPVFETPTKPDAAAAWGLDGIREARRLSRHTLVAIGGISSTNAREVIAAGADALAVVSAVCAAASPLRAAAELKALTARRREE